MSLTSDLVCERSVPRDLEREISCFDLDRLGFEDLAEDLDRLGFFEDLDRLGFSEDLDRLGFSEDLDRLGFSEDLDRLGFLEEDLDRLGRRSRALALARRLFAGLVDTEPAPRPALFSSWVSSMRTRARRLASDMFHACMT